MVNNYGYFEGGEQFTNQRDRRLYTETDGRTLRHTHVH